MLLTSDAIRVGQTMTTDDLFDRIGVFLRHHRLSPAPSHFAFAYEVITRPGSIMARDVAYITDGGVRLTSQDIERLGGVVTKGAPLGGPPESPAAPAAVAPAAHDPAQAAVTRALSQVETFADTVTAVHAETNDFGRDLKRSAQVMRDVGLAAGLDEVARLTESMIDRAHHAEVRLERAKRETEDLRTALEEARGSARTDPLTELPNRRAFDEAFAALDPAAPVTVAICDIDYFKRINDNFGHAVGDRVLRMVAQTLTAEASCMVARYGGEEFALLFANRDIEAAVAEVDAMRERLEARRLKVRETDQPLGAVTFSAGVAMGDAGMGRAALMARADAALYRAKDLGRSRTITAP
jgi:diguanylate cyclase